MPKRKVRLQLWKVRQVDKPYVLRTLTVTLDELPALIRSYRAAFKGV